LAAVKAMHKALYRSDLSLDQSIQAIEDLGNTDTQVDVDLMLGFLRQASPQRGIVR